MNTRMIACAAIAALLIPAGGLAGPSPARAVAGSLYETDGTTPPGCVRSLTIDAHDTGGIDRGTAIYGAGPSCELVRAVIELDCVDVPSAGAVLLHAAGEAQDGKRYVFRVAEGEGGTYLVSIRWQAGPGPCGTTPDELPMQGQLAVAP